MALTTTQTDKIISDFAQVSDVYFDHLKGLSDDTKEKLKAETKKSFANDIQKFNQLSQHSDEWKMEPRQSTISESIVASVTSSLESTKINLCQELTQEQKSASTLSDSSTTSTTTTTTLDPYMDSLFTQMGFELDTSLDSRARSEKMDYLLYLQEDCWLYRHRASTLTWKDVPWYRFSYPDRTGLTNKIYHLEHGNISNARVYVKNGTEWKDQTKFFMFEDSYHELKPDDKVFTDEEVEHLNSVDVDDDPYSHSIYDS